MKPNSPFAGPVGPKALAEKNRSKKSVIKQRRRIAISPFAGPVGPKAPAEKNIKSNSPFTDAVGPKALAEKNRLKFVRKIAATHSDQPFRNQAKRSFAGHRNA